MIFRKGFKYKFISRTRFAACLLLLAVYTGSFLLLKFPPSKSSNLVFCPLTKVWVQRGNFASRAENKSLKNICAAEESKQTFFNESFQKFFFTKSALDLIVSEDVFFDYLKRGNDAFAAILHSRNAPESPLVKTVASEKSLPGQQKDFSEKRVESFVLNQFARPPNALPPSTFDLESTRKLDKSARQIQPRAPPVST